MSVCIFPAPLLLLALVQANPTPTAVPQEQKQQEQVRAAVSKGRFVPLEHVVADALRRYPGKLIEVELEDDDEYEVEILGPDGVVMELEYDAVTGKLLKIEVED